MGKKNQLKEQDVFDEMLFDEDDYPNDMMSGIMSGMIDSCNHHMTVAVELTKLIVGNNPVKNMEEHVFSVFKNAIRTVNESFPLQKMIEQFER